MKKLLICFLLIYSFIISVTAQDVTPGIYTPGFYSSTNYIKNPFCFANTNDISNVTTGAKGRTTSTPLDGKASCTITGTSTGDKVKFATRTLDNSLNGKNCEARFKFSGDATKWKAYIEQSSAQASVDIKPQGFTSLIDTGSNSSEAYAYFPCGTNSNPINFVFEATASSAATIKVQPYVGPATGTGSVAQARLFGTVRVTGCAGGWSVSSASYAALSTQTGCSYAVTGDLSAPSTMIAGFSAASMPAGDYVVSYEGGFSNGGVANSSWVRFTDGTITTREESSLDWTTIQVPSVTQSFSYTAPQSNKTWQIHGKGSATPTVMGTNTYPGVFKVWYYPPASSIIQKADQSNTEPVYYTPSFGGISSLTPSTNMCNFEKEDGRMRGECSLIVGAQSSTQMTMTLPNNLTLNSSKIPNTATTSGPCKDVGTWRQNGATAYGAVLACTGTSTSLLYFGIYTNTAGQLTPQISNMITTSAPLDIKFNVPIQGWIGTNFINGTFDGTPSIPGYHGNVDTFSVSYGTTNMTTACTGTPCFIDQIGTAVSSVSWSSAGTYVMNTIKTYSKLKCVGNSIYSGVGLATMAYPVAANNVSSLSFSSRRSDTGAALDSYGTLYCQGTY